MTRENAINNILDKIEKDALIISATGKISRELYELRIKRKEKPHDFYMLGSMGHALSIGIGVAMNTDKNVYVLDGDGAILMQLGSISTMLYYKLNNLYHIVLNNSSYDSTGGQPTTFDSISQTLAELGSYVIDVEKGARKNLGRILIPPKQIVQNFYEKCQK